MVIAKELNFHPITCSKAFIRTFLTRWIEWPRMKAFPSGKLLQRFSRWIFNSISIIFHHTCIKIHWHHVHKRPFNFECYDFPPTQYLRSDFPIDNARHSKHDHFPPPLSSLSAYIVTGAPTSGPRAAEKSIGKFYGRVDKKTTTLGQKYLGKMLLIPRADHGGGKQNSASK